MIIEKITLFKSNLDMNYKNVLDYSWYKPLNIENVLIDIKNIFEYKDITLSKTKSIDGNMSETLTVNINELPNDFKEYNYIAITGRAYPEPASDKTVLFYFINSYEYAFSNEAIGHTINLKLKWDSWTNNIINIYNNKSKNLCLIKRRHKDTVSLRESTSDTQKTFSSVNLLTDELDVTTESEVTDSGKKVLFARIYLSPDASVTGVYKLYAPSLFTYGGIASMYPIRIMYIPVCVIDEKTRKIIDNYKFYKCKWTDDSNFEDQYDLFRLNYSILNAFAPFPPGNQPITVHENPSSSETTSFIINSKYFITDRGIVSNIDFSFHSPYSYRFVDSDNEAVYFSAEMSRYFSKITNSTADGTEALFGFAGTYKKDKFIKWTKDVNYKFVLNGIDRTITNEVRELIEPRIHQYPYEYFSIYSNTVEIPLIPDYDTNYFNIEMATINVTTPYLRIYRDTQPFNIKKYYISNSGSLQLSTDSLNEYLRNNSEKITERAVMGSISTGISMLTSKNSIEVAKNALSGIGNITSIIAQKADADNKADTVYIPQFLAINDTEMQDDIVTLHYEIKDDYDRNKLLHYFEYYGLNTNEVDTPFSDSRLNYDFVQTQNSDLSNIIKNQYEREELEKALNNGVTKWHIDTCYSEAIKKFDRQYINYQNSIGIAYGFLN